MRSDLPWRVAPHLNRARSYLCCPCFCAPLPLKSFFMRMLLEVLENVNGISGNEATNGTRGIVGEQSCHRDETQVSCLQVERSLVDGGSNLLCHFTSVKAVQHWESEPMPFDGLLRLLKGIDRERDDFGSQLIQLRTLSLKVQ